MKKLKKISVLLCMAALLTASVKTTVYAEETTENTEGETAAEQLSEEPVEEEQIEEMNESAEEQDESTEETVETETEETYNAAKEITPVPANTNNISNSYKATLSNGYTAMIRGLEKDAVKETFNWVDEYIDTVVADGVYLNMKRTEYVDADKYNLETSGYDMYHCWAATAANILWTTGYAQQAVSPYTKNKFASVDEVLTYFSQNFTDMSGCPYYGIQWFMNGKYVAAGDETFAQLKKAGSGKRLTSVNLDERDALISVLDDVMKIGTLESVTSDGIGVLIRWLNEDTKQLSDGAHWMTVVGVVIDESKPVTNSGHYRALIVANSDDSPVNGSLSAKRDAKTSAKAAQPNQYRMLRINYDPELHLWTLSGFDNSQGQSAVITHFSTLLDSDKTIEGKGDDDDEAASINMSDLIDRTAKASPDNSGTDDEETETDDTAAPAESYAQSLVGISVVNTKTE